MKMFLMLIFLTAFSFADDFKFIEKTEGLKRFFFIDEKIGWIIKNDIDNEMNLLIDSKLLFTENAGKKWKVMIEWSDPLGGGDYKKSTTFVISYGTEELGDVFFFNKEKGFVLSNRNIYKTENGGKTWIYEWNDDKKLKGTYLSIYFLNEQKGFLCGAKASLAITEDGGKTWKEISFDSDVLFKKIFFIDETHGFIIGGPEFKLNTSEIDEISLGKSIKCNSSILLKTEDAGKTWLTDILEKEDNILPFIGINDIFFFDLMNGFVVSEEGMIYKTEDRMRTFNLIKVDEDFLGRSIVFVDNKTGYVCGNKYDFETDEEQGVIYKTKDGGKTWEKIFTKKGSFNQIQFIKDKKIIFFGGTAGIYYLKIK